MVEPKWDYQSIAKYNPKERNCHWALKDAPAYYKIRDQITMERIEDGSYLKKN